MTCSSPAFTSCATGCRGTPTMTNLVLQPQIVTLPLHHCENEQDR